MVCDGVWSLTWRECFYIKKYIILARPHLCWVYTSRTLNDMALLKNNYIAWEWLIAREVLSSCTSKAYVPTVLSCFLCWIRSLINKLGKNVRLQPWCHLNTFMCTQTPRIQRPLTSEFRVHIIWQPYNFYSDMIICYNCRCVLQLLLKIKQNISAG